MYKRLCIIILSINSKYRVLFFTNASLAENKLTPSFLLCCFVTLLLSFLEKFMIFLDLSIIPSEVSKYWLTSLNEIKKIQLGNFGVSVK